MKRIIVIMTIILVSLIIAGCGSTTKDEAQADLTIYTSIYPIQYAVERIGGDTVHAESVYPPGVDAHSYEPTTKKMTSIASSDAFIYMGAGMEGFAETAADALKSQNVNLVELGKHKELFDSENEEHNEEDHKDDGHHHGDHNPHIWLDPQRMISMADLVKQALIDLNPDKKELYTDNFEALKKDLSALDSSFKKTMQPKQNKKILVSHAAYGYWEERYGIEQIAIRGITSSDEPSQKELTSIIKQAKENDVHYILFEQNSSDRISNIMQEQLNANVEYIHNLEVLTEDDINQHENYLSLMEHNLHVLDKVTK
ncbi:zinc ABC transporter substrate-binding protein [Lentibacillus sp. N15]|uniref:metal ABC transporter substrate-binding protein n=1 Tax=Lentibacillus songyuanensis TaxID=3136161 RepID=UPI0031BB8391